MLDYQWNTVAIPYWQAMEKFAADHGDQDRLRDAPRHAGLQRRNAAQAARRRPARRWAATSTPATCGGTASIRSRPSASWATPSSTSTARIATWTIYNVSVNGCNDNKPYDQILDRAWTFRTIGYGHGAKVWKDYCQRPAADRL